MSLQMVNEFIIVKPLDKQNKKSEGSPFTQVVSSNNLGVVKHSSNPEFPEGTHVYFNGSSERIMVDGVEVLAMKWTNIVAKLVDSKHESEK